MEDKALRYSGRGLFKTMVGPQELVRQQVFGILNSFYAWRCPEVMRDIIEDDAKVFIERLEEHGYKIVKV